MFFNLIGYIFSREDENINLWNIFLDKLIEKKKVLLLYDLHNTLTITKCFTLQYWYLLSEQLVFVGGKNKLLQTY